MRRSYGDVAGSSACILSRGDERFPFAGPRQVDLSPRLGPALKRAASTTNRVSSDARQCRVLLRTSRACVVRQKVRRRRLEHSAPDSSTSMERAPKFPSMVIMADPDDIPVRRLAGFLFMTISFWRAIIDVTASPFGFLETFITLLPLPSLKPHAILSCESRC